MFFFYLNVTKYIWYQVLPPNRNLPKSTKQTRCARFLKSLLRVVIYTYTQETMSLWVDKYRPKELSKLDYHLEQAGHLKKLVS